MGKKRAIINRIITTVILTAFLVLALFLYGQLQGPVEGSVAVAQLEDSNTTYITSRSIADGLMGKLLISIYGICVVLVWGPFLVSCTKEKCEEKEEEKK
jgi:hypothetical protein